MKHNLLRGSLVALPLLLVAGAASAEEAHEAPASPAAPVTPAESPSPAPAPRSDYLFPDAGRPSMSFATGIPFIAMTELAVGVTDRFAVGALAGIAMSGDGPPTNVGFGLRPRVDAWHFTKNTRLTMVAPTLYYPIVRGTWFLTRPTVQVEHTFESGRSIYGGGGAVIVMTQDALLGKTPDGKAVLPYGGTPGQKAGNDGTNGIWNTVNVGGALPIGAHTHVFGEAALILRGVNLPGDEWVGGVPFTVTLGVGTSL